MKVLLIDPPFYRFIGYYNRYFPVGLSSLAACLRKAGHEALVYDADCNVNPANIDFSRLEDSYPLYLKCLKDDGHAVWREVRRTVSDFSPDVVGITVWTTFAASAFKVASIIKGMDGSVPVIMGGPHVTIRHDEVLKICPDVDFLVRGEGEETLLELVEFMGSRGRGAAMTDGLKAIKGISFMHDGSAVHTPDREFIGDLDAIPFPARDLLLGRSAYNSEDMGLLMTSRGCPYACSYCATSIWKRNTRYRTVDNVVEEIRHVMKTCGTTQFTFKDDSFTVNRKRALEFCDRLIRENMKISWDANTRVNLVDEELLRRMKRAGCNSIKVGIESGSERVLALMEKRITLDDCRRAAGLFRRVGIHWTGYFMMGLPTETREDALKTLEFMKELRPDYASFCTYEPFPGTALFEMGLGRGLTRGEQTMDDFFKVSPKYYYVKDLSRRSDTMSGEEFDALDEHITRAFNRYNRGVARVLSRVRARSRVYLREPRILFDDVRKFCAWV